jgi:hypothetical protein
MTIVASFPITSIAFPLLPLSPCLSNTRLHIDNRGSLCLLPGNFRADPGKARETLRRRPAKILVERARTEKEVMFYNSLQTSDSEPFVRASLKILSVLSNKVVWPPFIRDFCRCLIKTLPKQDV